MLPCAAAVGSGRPRRCVFFPTECLPTPPHPISLCRPGPSPLLQKRAIVLEAEKAKAKAAAVVAKQKAMAAEQVRPLSPAYPPTHPPIVHR
jgi:hypothetical protein